MENNAIFPKKIETSEAPTTISSFYIFIPKYFSPFHEKYAGVRSTSSWKIRD